MLANASDFILLSVSVAVQGNDYPMGSDLTAPKKNGTNSEL